VLCKMRAKRLEEPRWMRTKRDAEADLRLPGRKLWRASCWKNAKVRSREILGAERC